jgi:virginiamycin B lyase
MSSTRTRIALVLATVAVLPLVLSPVASAAPAAKLVQHRVPTDGASPSHIVEAADGNFWFTESFLNDQNAQPHNVARITPGGDVTEFPVCDFCFPTDIAQGSDGNLYYTRNDAPLGRVAPDGTNLGIVGTLFQFNGGGVGASGDDLWITDFNNLSVWRYDIPTDTLTEFPAPGTTPLDVAVDAGGTVWFADGNGAIGRLDPTTGAVTTTPVPGFPREIAVASDGTVWFTERFTPQGVGRLVPATSEVTVFPLDGGPLSLAATASGGMWVTRSTAGNVVRVESDGTVSFSSKAIKGSEPWGITVASNGHPWFAMLSADKIGHLVLP